MSYIPLTNPMTYKRAVETMERLKASKKYEYFVPIIINIARLNYKSQRGHRHIVAEQVIDAS